MKRLPNILSCCRLVLSPQLLFTANNIILFFIIYLTCGITDIMDGVIARKYNGVSPTGAKLDSFADMIFILIIMKLLYPHLRAWYQLLFILCILIIRVVNLVITKIKFKQYNVIHTICNKAAGFALFLSVPVFLFFTSVSTYLFIFLALLAFLASTEEMCILFIFSDYDENKMSLLRYHDKKIILRRKEAAGPANHKTDTMK